MGRKTIFLISIGLIVFCTRGIAQSVDTAIEELQKRGLLTRTIEKYNKDPGQYAYLKDLILVAYDLVRKGTVTAELTTKLNKLESEITKLKSARTTGETAIDEESIKDLVRAKVSELMRFSEDKIGMLEASVKNDSLRVVQLEKKLKSLEEKSPAISKESPQWGILGAVVFASIIALLSAH
ncbi:MAG: hypothetical protein ABIL02_00320 [candidate division WOR-3 bacterium]